jgi:hypothetical protein
VVKKRYEQWLDRPEQWLEDHEQWLEITNSGEDTNEW